MKPQFNTAPDAFTLTHSVHEPEFQQAYKGLWSACPLIASD